MTMIVLAKPVQVPTGDGNFVTAKAGVKVNYSCVRRDDGLLVHQFSYWDFNKQRILTYVEVGQSVRPDWMGS